MKPDNKFLSIETAFAGLDLARDEPKTPIGPSAPLTPVVRPRQACSPSIGNTPPFVVAPLPERRSKEGFLPPANITKTSAAPAPAKQSPPGKFTINFSSKVGSPASVAMSIFTSIAMNEPSPPSSSSSDCYSTSSPSTPALSLSSLSPEFGYKSPDNHTFPSIGDVGAIRPVPSLTADWFSRARKWSHASSLPDTPSMSDNESFMSSYFESTVPSSPAFSTTSTIGESDNELDKLSLSTGTLAPAAEITGPATHLRLSFVVSNEADKAILPKTYNTSPVLIQDFKFAGPPAERDEGASVADLKAEIMQRMGSGDSAEAISLFHKGKKLHEGDQIGKQFVKGSLSSIPPHANDVVVVVRC